MASGSGGGAPYQWVPPKFTVTGRPGPQPPRNHNPQLIYTCEVLGNYVPDKKHFPSQEVFNRAISVTKGQNLFAIEPKHKERWPSYVLVSLGNGLQEGFVPSMCLKPGTLLTNPKIRDFAPSFNQLSSLSIAQGSCFFRTLDALLLEIVAQRRALEQVGCNSSTLEFLARNTILVRDTIYGNVLKDMMPVIQNGNATFDSLAQISGVRPSIDDHRIAVYLILHNGVPDVGYGPGAIYAGKTENLGLRYSAHKSGWQPNSSTRGSHYKIARKASGGHKMLLFNSFARGTADIGPILQISEEVSQLLFGTMNPALVSVSRSFDNTEMRWYMDALAATSLKSLARAVFQRTGWVPPNNHGCNWSSALIEGHSTKAVWLCHEALDQHNNTVDMYTLAGKSYVARHATTAKNAPKKKTGIFIVLLSGGTDTRGKVKITIPGAESQGITQGTRIYPVVEIYTGRGDCPHPVPFARLPEPGPFSDWQSLNRIGLRIEWQTPEGQWRTRYVQVSGGLFSLPDKSQCKTIEETYASDLYKKVSCIFDMFKNIQYRGGLPSFKKQGPSLIIKKVCYSHLHQEFFMADMPPCLVDAPTLVSFKHNASLLMQMCPRIAIGLDVPARGLSSSTKSTRKLDDFCFSTAQTAFKEKSTCPTYGDRGDPEYGDHQSCASNQWLRRPSFFQQDVPFRGVHISTNQIPPHMARLLWRELRTDDWGIQAPTHIGQGVGRDDLGPTEEEVENDAADDAGIDVPEI